MGLPKQQDAQAQGMNESEVAISFVEWAKEGTAGWQAVVRAEQLGAPHRCHWADRFTLCPLCPLPAVPTLWEAVRGQLEEPSLRCSAQGW